MNKEIKAEWLKRLRSGEYQQAKKQLHTQDDTGDSFCCLGVLCDMHREMTQDGYWRSTEYTWYYHTDEDEDNATLPMSVYEWAGLDDECPNVFIHTPQEGTIAVYNDGGYSRNDKEIIEPHTFSEIADIIEEQF